jgi:hypothetical protein
MCTVTFLPRPSGFILTHNRDEAASRTTHTIVREQMPGGDTLLFPRDTAGGTWIASSTFGRTACLLNGAFVLHRRELPYRRSRGLILLDFFDWEDSADFFQQYDLDRIEPFTLLAFERSRSDVSKIELTEFRWDGQQRHLKNLDSSMPHFWCSATLYPADMQLRREQVFRAWLAKQAPKALVGTRAILNLHQTGSVGDPENDFVMNRAGRVQTVSITQVIVNKKNAHMRYYDLLGEKNSERRLKQSERAANTVNR